MTLFSKEIERIKIDDIENFLNDIGNESHRVDFKEFLSANDAFSYEFLRDVVSFANTDETGIILYGVTDKEKKIVGMKTEDSFNGDKLQTHLVNILNERISPNIINNIEVQPIYFQNSRFITIVRIKTPKNKIYSLYHKKELCHNKTVDLHEFWIRGSGSKKQITFNELLQIKKLQNDETQSNNEIFRAYNQVMKLMDLAFITKNEDLGPNYPNQLKILTEFIRNHKSNLQDFLNLTTTIDEKEGKSSGTNTFGYFTSARTLIKFLFYSQNENEKNFDISISYNPEKISKVNGSIGKNTIHAEGKFILDYYLQFKFELCNYINNQFSIKTQEMIQLERFYLYFDEISEAYRRNQNFQEILQQIFQDDKILEMFAIRGVTLCIETGSGEYYLQMNDKDKIVEMRVDITENIFEQFKFESWNDIGRKLDHIKSEQPDLYKKMFQGMSLHRIGVLNQLWDQICPEMAHKNEKEWIESFQHQFCDSIEKERWSHISFMYENNVYEFQKLFPLKIIEGISYLKINHYSLKLSKIEGRWISEIYDSSSKKRIDHKLNKKETLDNNSLMTKQIFKERGHLISLPLFTTPGF
ncbi:hypothetical protein NEF87_004845 [Candidatus Lokiarchaeum ossiferum]|uniref:Schlafen AlbA-2 domain-containing protein n=1 Tax=Candidatus Lokiarchaeum ossiferum TaxID=2951803 RepID=A0ABY6HYR6_9ARCH|nr:hypothetical protein NEF87_004845 [Candidatus Lokiarchaeum sp. B-35]